MEFRKMVTITLYTRQQRKAFKEAPGGKGTSLVAQSVKNLPVMQETQVQYLGREYSLQKEMTTHSSILAWEIPWTEGPDGLQSMGSQRVVHD